MGAHGAGGRAYFEQGGGDIPVKCRGSIIQVIKSNVELLVGFGKVGMGGIPGGSFLFQQGLCGFELICHRF